jgi:hypothetical protein
MAYGDYMGRDEFLEEMREATKPRVVVSDITSDQKEMMLLHIIAGMGGETDSSESKWSWLNWFCGDEREGTTKTPSIAATPSAGFTAPITATPIRASPR